MSDRTTVSIPAHHDADTLASTATEIDSFLDYEEQSRRLDDSTREAFVVALEVLRDAAEAYRKEGI